MKHTIELDKQDIEQLIANAYDVDLKQVELRAYKDMYDDTSIIEAKINMNK